MFSIQVDESADVASCSQLLVFVRYMHMVRCIHIHMVHYIPMELHTYVTYISHYSRCNRQHLKFFNMKGLQWKKLRGVCMDGAPAMLVCKSGFQMKVKEKFPGVRGVHCMIRRYTHACKTLPNFMKKCLTLL